MLRMKLELVPFGYDANARTISSMYLGNLGIVVKPDSKVNLYSYIIGYFEPPSYFAADGVAKFKLIKAYDRNQSSFTMLTTIYDKKGWVTLEDIAELQDFDLSKAIDIMKQRAMEDLGWNGEKA